MLKTKENTAPGRKNLVFLRSAAAIAAGLILGSAPIAGGLFPLLPALTGALDITGGMFAFIGGMLSHLMSGSISSALGEITALLGILIVKVIYYEFGGRECKAAGSAFIVTGASALCGIIVALAEAGGAAGILSALAGAVLSGSVTYFIMTAVNAFRREGKLVLTGINGGALAGILVAIIAALASIEPLFFNFGRIAGTAVILIAVRRFKSAGGALISALALCGFALYSPELARPAMLVGICAVIAGAFSNKHPLSLLMIFIASNAAGLTLVGMTPGNARLLADLIAGCGLFLLIPDKAINAVLGNASFNPTAEYSEAIASRLDFEAKTIHSVRKNLIQLSSALESRRIKGGGISVRVCDKVCGRCRSNLLCWETRFDDTYKYFEEMSRKSEKSGFVTESDIPDGLSECINKQGLSAEFTAAAGALKLEIQAENRIRAMQGILAEQMTASEKILCEISRELTEEKNRNHDAEKEIKSVLLDRGAKNPKVRICTDEEERYYGEIYFTGDTGITAEELSLELSGLLDSNTEVAEITSTEGITKISFREIPDLKLETGTAQKPGEKDKVSGDSHGIFRDHNGNVCVLISDGMGSGKQAAVDSCMTVSYLSKFLKAGTGLDGALHLVNSALLTKSREESFATVDLARIDPHTGDTELVKLGASSTFLLSGGKLSSLGMRSFPVGILGDIHPERKNFRLKNGDILVMTTDGIEENEYPAVTEVLKQSAELSAEEISREILKAASLVPKENPRDDVTVVTVKVHNSEI